MPQWPKYQNIFGEGGGQEHAAQCPHTFTGLKLSIVIGQINNTHIKIDSLSSTEAGTLKGNPYILCRRYCFNKLQFFDSFTDV